MSYNGACASAASSYRQQEQHHTAGAGAAPIDEEEKVVAKAVDEFVFSTPGVITKHVAAVVNASIVHDPELSHVDPVALDELAHEEVTSVLAAEHERVVFAVQTDESGVVIDDTHVAEDNVDADLTSVFGTFGKNLGATSLQDLDDYERYFGVAFERSPTVYVDAHGALRERIGEQVAHPLLGTPILDLLLHLEENGLYANDAANRQVLKDVRKKRANNDESGSLTRIVLDILKRRHQLGIATKAVKDAKTQAATTGVQAPAHNHNVHLGARLWRVAAAYKRRLLHEVNDTVSGHPHMLFDLGIEVYFGVKPGHAAWEKLWEKKADASHSQSEKRVRRFVQDKPDTPGGKLIAWFAGELREHRIVLKPRLRREAAKFFHECCPDTPLPSGWLERWMARCHVRAFSILRRINLPADVILARLQSFDNWLLKVRSPDVHPDDDMIVNFDEIPWSRAGGMGDTALGGGGTAPATNIRIDANESKRCCSLIAISVIARRREGERWGEWFDVPFPWLALFIGARAQLPDASSLEMPRAGGAKPLCWKVCRNDSGVVNMVWMSTIFVPWLAGELQRVRREERMPLDRKKAVVIMDSASGHIAPMTIAAFHAHVSEIPVCVIPGGITSLKQHIDVYVAGPLRQLYRAKRDAVAGWAEMSSQQRLNEMMRIIIGIVAERSKSSERTVDEFRKLGYMGPLEVRTWAPPIAQLGYIYGSATGNTMMKPRAARVPPPTKGLAMAHGMHNQPLMDNFFKRKPAGVVMEQSAPLVAAAAAARAAEPAANRVDADAAEVNRQRPQQQQQQQPQPQQQQQQPQPARLAVVDQKKTEKAAAPFRQAEIDVFRLINGNTAKQDLCCKHKKKRAAEEKARNLARDAREKAIRSPADEDLQRNAEELERKMRADSLKFSFNGVHASDCQWTRYREWVDAARQLTAAPPQPQQHQQQQQQQQETQQQQQQGQFVAGLSDAVFAFLRDDAIVQKMPAKAMTAQDAAVFAARELEHAGQQPRDIAATAAFFVRGKDMCASVLDTIIANELRRRDLVDATGFAYMSPMLSDSIVRVSDTKETSEKPPLLTREEIADALGLRCPSFMHEFNVACDARLVAAIICHSAHFVVLVVDRTGRDTRVALYDSLPGHFPEVRDSCARTVLAALGLGTQFPDAASVTPTLVAASHVGDIQAGGSNDCGVYCIRRVLEAVRVMFPTHFAQPQLQLQNFTDIDSGHLRRAALLSFVEAKRPKYHALQRALERADPARDDDVVVVGERQARVAEAAAAQLFADGAIDGTGDNAFDQCGTQLDFASSSQVYAPYLSNRIRGRDGAPVEDGVSTTDGECDMTDGECEEELEEEIDEDVALLLGPQ